ncbi:MULTISPECIES: PRC-barrel domain-containing protein [Streptomyces]|uniref:PRC-barrel domain-containing protein n=1 Tax=Streptomyces TaxID=1883 RepID=UPI00163C3C90|nr:MULTISPECIES: PRC-barrel domain-containing protein [Streptomyces]MBC2876557.1 PRC-barrel domain-containing protein [Streptomyces sp. TYQ1024]UBI40772.1 PRC-barrel domain-containing protein [Streptomyces mobaraensis]UKW33352.1 PRC-barrel domain-containing protein [Streptomyces sp. TYQ1024]
MMLFSGTKGLPVVTADEAAELGTVEALAVEAPLGLIGHLRLSGSGGPARKGRAWLPWSLVRAVGPDAVIVRSAAEPVVAREPDHHEILGRRVLTDRGDEHGTVKDVAFDPATGRIGTVHTTQGNVSGHRLLGLGDYALVVRAE